MLSLGHLGGMGRCPGSEATAVNARGEVVGWAWSGAGANQAFVWTADRGMLGLGTLSKLPGGYSYGTSYAADISDSGQVVGWSDIPAYGRHAFSWTAAGGIVDLGTLGGAYSTAVAVNDSGQVIGTSQAADGAMHGFSWTAEGGMVDLGPVGANPGPRAVNDCGEVVGAMESGRAFLWTARAGMIDLGTLGGSRSNATAINNRSQVVGSSETADGSWHAVLWKPRVRSLFPRWWPCDAEPTTTSLASPRH